MSRSRTWELDEKRRDRPPGRCRWCFGDVAPPRRTFCSDECVDEWNLRARPNEARRIVRLRDGGICAGCGLDALVLERDLAAISFVSASRFVLRVRALENTGHSGIAKRVRGWNNWTIAAEIEAAIENVEAKLAEISPGELRDELARERRSLDVHLRAARLHLREYARKPIRSLWEVDHVVALEEGGTGAVGNLQTLCWRCHAAKTAEHAGRRARKVGTRVPAP